MPALEVRHLKQKAVLWRQVGHDSNGEPTVSAAEEIKARWEQGTRQSIDSDASPILISGSIGVDQDIPEGSILWLGKLEDLPDPVTLGLVQVVSMDKSPNIKARRFSRSVTVQKWRATLPTIV